MFSLVLRCRQLFLHIALIRRRLGLRALVQGGGYQRIKIRWCDIRRGYASLFWGVGINGLKSIGVILGEATPLCFWGISKLLSCKVARLKTTATGLSRIAINDIKG